MRISKMWWREQSLAELHEMLKTFTKSSLDKSSKVWYNIKVAARKCDQQKVISSTVSWKLNNALQVQKTLEIQESVREDDKKTQNKSVSNWQDRYKQHSLCIYNFTKEFDPGSGRTLAARLTHASRAEIESLLSWSAADGWVTREQPAFQRGTTVGNDC